MNKKVSSGLFFFLIAMLLVITISARSPVDSDMWWHIRSGERTLQSGAPLLTDVFSFTRNGAAWTNHSWLAQVILYLIFRSSGFVGLAIYTAFLAAVSMGLLYRLIDGPPLLKTFLTVFAAVACALVWTPRPQMFSLVFFIGFYSLLLAFKQRKKAPIWLIPLGFALWSNLHAGFALGLILLVVFLATEVAGRLFLYPPSECLSWKEIRTLALWSLTAVPAVLLNPNGLQTWLIPFQTVGITALQNLIQEWASPDFHIFTQQVILWLLFLLIISFSLTGKRMGMTDLLVPLAFAYLTFLARRNIAAFAMTAIPSLSRGLLASWQTWWEKARQDENVRRLLESPTLARLMVQNSDLTPAISRVFNLVIIAFLAALAFGRLGVMSLNGVVAHTIEMDYPAAAVRWLDVNPVEGNLFDEYNWGGYLIFAHPQNPIFVDGRTDLYGDEIISEWQKVILADPQWQSILDKWDVQAALLQPDRPVVTLMKEHGWRTGFENDKSVLLLRK